mmetsp:Transcript_5208/g.15246  ORF Transcript_5208/g.15246 Transcript_5208/m.15246 type:complete len:227 (-) Transcript_5208:22-702(-)
MISILGPRAAFASVRASAPAAPDGDTSGSGALSPAVPPPPCPEPPAGPVAACVAGDASACVAACSSGSVTYTEASSSTCAPLCTAWRRRSWSRSEADPLPTCAHCSALCGESSRRVSCARHRRSPARSSARTRQDAGTGVEPVPPVGRKSACAGPAAPSATTTAVCAASAVSGTNSRRTACRSGAVTRAAPMATPSPEAARTRSSCTRSPVGSCPTWHHCLPLFPA